MSAVTHSREDFDVAIVGAGFAGLACARSVALRGMRALVIERSSAEKRVIRTTGLLVKEAAERWEVPARLTRRVRGVRIYAPAMRYVDLQAPGYYFLATDTAALMQWLTHEAADIDHAGAAKLQGQGARGQNLIRRQCAAPEAPIGTLVVSDSEVNLTTF